jgi:tRNA(Met) C34 N-acetyltransferase TmcA
MDKSEVEELRQASAQNESLRAHNKKMKRILQELKTKLEELNLQNARLLYTNKVLTDTSLNEQQKTKIAELVSHAKSAEESRTIFETLQKTMAHTRQRKTQSLSEVVSRKSSVILSSRHNDKNTADSSAPTLNRWATLAGLNNTDNK